MLPSAPAPLEPAPTSMGVDDTSAASASKGAGFADLVASIIALKSRIALSTRSLVFRPWSVAG